MTFTEAAVEILKLVGRPLHYKKITELAIERMRGGLPVRFHPAEGGVRIEGVLVECSPDGRATRCEPVRVPVE